MLEEKRIETNSMKAWLLAARPKTLSGAAVPVMIGVSLAYVDAKTYGDDVFSWLAAVLCLLFAFVMQIDANFINDFFDLPTVPTISRPAWDLVALVQWVG